MARKEIIGLAAYGLIAIGTFGHAANHTYQEAKAEYRECKAKYEGYCFDDSGMAVLAGGLSGAVWPLYWSWELQSQ